MIAVPDRAAEAEERKGGTCVRRPCRVYHLWPELKVLKSRGLNLPSLSDDNREVSLYIQTFMNRPNFSEPAQPLSADVGYSHIHLQKDVGFWLGNVVVGTHGEASPISRIDVLPRHQGEIDIGIMLGYVQEDTAALATNFNNILDIAIPILTTTLNDYLVPITPIQVDVWRGTDRKFISPQTFDFERKERGIVSVDLLAEAFDGFCSSSRPCALKSCGGLR